MAKSRYGGITGEIHIKDDFENINKALLNVEAESDQRKAALDSHINNTTAHVTATEKTNWNSKASGTELATHIADDERHLTTADRDKLDNLAANVKAFSQVNDVVAKGPDSKLNIKAGPGIIISTNPTAGELTISGEGGGVPDKHGKGHNIGGADEIPDLSKAVTEAGEAKAAADEAKASATEALTLAQNAESKEGAQAKVDALKGLSGLPNLLSNSTGFLSFTNWTPTGFWGIGSSTGVMTAFYHGSKDTASLVSDSINVDSNREYTISADMYTRGLSGTTWGIEVCTIDQSKVIATLYADANSSWHRKDLRFVVPAEISQIRIKVFSRSTEEASTKYISQIMLNKGIKSAPWNDFMSLQSLALMTGGKRSTTGNSFYYVDIVNGSDLNDGSTANKAFKTLNRVVALLEGLTINHGVNITVAPGTYPSLWITGLVGIGAVNFNGQTSNGNMPFISKISFNACSPKISISGFSLSGGDPAIALLECTRVSISRCKIEKAVSANQPYGIQFVKVFWGEVVNCTINNMYVAIQSMQSHINSIENSGSDNTFGLSVREGGVIAKNGTQPNASVMVSISSGGVIR
jgi:hypothetical protein